MTGLRKPSVCCDLGECCDFEGGGDKELCGLGGQNNSREASSSCLQMLGVYIAP